MTAAGTLTESSNFSHNPEHYLHFWLKDSKVLRKNSSNILKMTLLGMSIFLVSTFLTLTKITIFEIDLPNINILSTLFTQTFTLSQ